MITYLDLNDSGGNAVRFHGDGVPYRRVVNLEGLPGVNGFSAPRVSSYPAPGRHGSITRTRFQSQGLVTVSGIVNGESQAQLVGQMDELRAVLMDALDTSRLLTWERADGVELQAEARLASALQDEKIGPAIQRFNVSLSLDDPRGFTQALSSSVGGGLTGSGGDTFADIFPDTFDATAGGTAAVDNTGTRPTPAVFRLYGMAEDPQIVLVETGERIVLSGTINAGDYLQIDVAARTVKLNGTSSAQGMVSSANTTWFELPRGTSTLRTLALSNDAGAHLEVDYRAAFA